MITIAREITEDKVYQEANTFRVLMHIALTSNDWEEKIRGKMVLRGELRKSINTIAEELNLRPAQVQYAITKLRKYKLISTKRIHNKLTIKLNKNDVIYLI
jgi:predicted transcriptional regulator